MIFTVYGIFHGETCVYVGQTSNWHARVRAHTSGKASRFFGCASRVLLVTHNRRAALRAERDAILRYRAMGEAIGNRNPNYACRIKKVPSDPVAQWAPHIKGMQAGEHFFVPTESDRQTANRIAKTLRAAGVIDFDVVTKKAGEKFKVAAI